MPDTFTPERTARFGNALIKLVPTESQREISRLLGKNQIEAARATRNLKSLNNDDLNRGLDLMNQERHLDVEREIERGEIIDKIEFVGGISETTYRQRMAFDTRVEQEQRQITNFVGSGLQTSQTVVESTTQNLAGETQSIRVIHNNYCRQKCMELAKTVFDNQIDHARVESQGLLDSESSRVEQHQAHRAKLLKMINGKGGQIERAQTVREILENKSAGQPSQGGEISMLGDIIKYSKQLVEKCSDLNIRDNESRVLTELQSVVKRINNFH